MGSAMVCQPGRHHQLLRVAALGEDLRDRFDVEASFAGAPPGGQYLARPYAPSIDVAIARELLRFLRDPGVPTSSATSWQQIELAALGRRDLRRFWKLAACFAKAVVALTNAPVACADMASVSGVM